jgi:hypothetical protein
MRRNKHSKKRRKTKHKVLSLSKKPKKIKTEQIKKSKHKTIASKLKSNKVLQLISYV